MSDQIFILAFLLLVFFAIAQWVCIYVLIAKLKRRQRDFVEYRKIICKKSKANEGLRRQLSFDLSQGRGGTHAS